MSSGTETQGDGNITPDKQVKFNSQVEAKRDIADEENINDLEGDPFFDAEQEETYKVDEDAMLELDITEGELEDLKKEFAYFDIDKDGTIAVLDFATVVRGQGFNPSEKELADMTAQYDSDGTGTLDFREVLMLVGNLKLKKTEEDEDDPCQDLVECFKVFDKDENGYLTGPELRYILSHIGECMTDEEIDELLKCADPEGEDRIDYEEFAVLMTSKYT